MVRLQLVGGKPPLTPEQARDLFMLMLPDDSEVLGLYLVVRGMLLQAQTPEGQILLTPEELAEERRREAEERQRAEEEVARLRREIERLRGEQPDRSG